MGNCSDHNKREEDAITISTSISTPQRDTKTHESSHAKPTQINISPIVFKKREKIHETEKSEEKTKVERFEEKKIETLSLKKKREELEALSLRILESIAGFFEIHFGIVCDSCLQSDFCDYRYKCLICKDYDLCGNCYEKRKVSKDHKANHPMLMISDPMRSSDSKTLNLLFSLGADFVIEVLQEVTFEVVNCDNCKMSPIKGPRVKCDQCPDYDLCWSCYKSNHITAPHKLSHAVLVQFSPQVHNFDLDKDITYLDNKSESGCFGTVRKVRYKSRAKPAALKKITLSTVFPSPALIKSFKNELFAYGALNSNSILRYYGYATKKEGLEINLYILTEFMEGGSLQKVIKEKQSHSIRRRFQWLFSVIRGLRRIHEKGFVHKDIKPDNILLNKFSEAKIGDMGVAVHHGGTYYFSDFMAPIHYSAPEILENKKFTNKIDIYSFGLLVNELFTYQSHTTTTKGKHIITKKSEYFLDLIEACTSVDPTDRPTAEEIEDKMEKFNAFFWENIPMKMKDYVKLSIVEKDKIFKRVYQKGEVLVKF